MSAYVSLAMGVFSELSFILTAGICKINEYLEKVLLSVFFACILSGIKFLQIVSFIVNGSRHVPNC